MTFRFRSFKKGSLVARGGGENVVARPWLARLLLDRNVLKNMVSDDDVAGSLISFFDVESTLPPEVCALKNDADLETLVETLQPVIRRHAAVKFGDEDWTGCLARNVQVIAETLGLNPVEKGILLFAIMLQHDFDFSMVISDFVLKIPQLAALAFERT